MLHDPNSFGFAGEGAHGLVLERDRTGSAASARRALIELARLAEQSAAVLPERIAEAGEMIAAAIESGAKVMACGNGGSAADASHFVAELIGRMGMERAPLPAMSLAVDPGVLTCIGNDYGYEQLFARQVRGLGQPGDVLVAMSTSGRSPNVLAAIEAAADADVRTIVLTGTAGDTRLEQSDVLIRVPSRDTARIQEIHTATLHAICEVVERVTFGC